MIAEHHLVNGLLEELALMPKDSDEWFAKFGVLKEPARAPAPGGGAQGGAQAHPPRRRPGGQPHRFAVFSPARWRPRAILN